VTSFGNLFGVEEPVGLGRIDVRAAGAPFVLPPFTQGDMVPPAFTMGRRHYRGEEARRNAREDTQPRRMKEMKQQSFLDDARR
jgi:hypothetical protein